VEKNACLVTIPAVSVKRDSSVFKEFARLAVRNAGLVKEIRNFVLVVNLEKNLKMENVRKFVLKIVMIVVFLVKDVKLDLKVMMVEKCARFVLIIWRRIRYLLSF
jgi:hypothetical protein